MILKLNNTVGIGKPCIVYDAENEEVLYIIFANTETGEIERRAHDGTGFILDENFDTEIIKETRQAPLRVEWLSEGIPNINKDSHIQWDENNKAILTTLEEA